MEANRIGAYNWISKEDLKLKPEDQVIWQISTLTFAQDTWLEDKISRGEPEGSIIAHLLNMGVIGVQNFKDRDGKLIEAKRMQVEPDTALETQYPGDLLPWADNFLTHIKKIDRATIALQVRYGRELTKAELKN